MLLLIRDKKHHGNENISETRVLRMTFLNIISLNLECQRLFVLVNIGFTERCWKNINLHKNSFNY